MFESPEERAQRKEWLAGLKVGDVVYLNIRHDYASFYPTKTKVSNITPTRRFRVEGRDKLFNDYGEQGDYGRESLQPWSEAIEQDLRQKQAHHDLVSKVGTFLAFAYISREKLEKADDAALTNMLKLLQSFGR